MFWNKKKPKSKPQIKTTVPKTFKAKEPPPKWQPTFGETKQKGEKPPEVTTKSEPKIDWEDKFLKSFQKLTYRRRAWDVWRDYILLHASYRVCHSCKPGDEAGFGSAGLFSEHCGNGCGKAGWYDK